MTTIRYIRPTGFAATLNKCVGWLADRGISLAGAHTLTVVGRVSGNPQRVPVNPVTVAGTRYLVSTRGRTQWVRNLVVAGEAELSVGRRRVRVAATELRDEDKTDVLREYLRRWGWQVAGTLPRPVTARSTEAEFAAIAGDIPVFALRECR